ncbi:hypothetical protein EYE40_01395 [Glaciihabitans arcticus]|uniref:DUF5655 domain-containing protein n=1 Tax=Glaciihabitans arcticus TaxID=2668039 RepID=A0A4Q9GNC6_9MICO|nr:DUF5655 domain-containing protein [Glaciihabitans arcticus]TBN56155.1 hypothetical protein EYE40_01395 [Glaciihabitans arcticus]
MRSTWAALTEGLDDKDLALFTAYRELVTSLGEVEERVNSSEISFAVKRVFTSGYMKSHYLEVGIELLREAKHPQLRTSFATSKKVTMHRMTLTTVAQLHRLRPLLLEARDAVGPGTR